MKDLKYLFAYSIPLVTFISVYFKGIFSYTAPIYAFIFIPILEIILKDSDKKYTEEEKSNRLANILFDVLLYLNLPFVFSILFYGFFVITSSSYLSYEYVGMILSLGILLATNAINVAHELGHRKSQFEKTLSKILLMPCLYMHFYIEHNFGHHINVATPKDPATSKFNQSVYNFWFTSVFWQYINAWKTQILILKRNNKSFVSFQNDMIWYIAFQSLYLLFVFYLFGLKGLIVALIVGVISFLFLETINYIEHYGLERKILPSGRYERVQLHHSWNSNHIIGRIVLYELTRHSDHHYSASKKYQILENQPVSPQLPYGYPTSILIALVPPIWFRLMNSRIPNK